MAVSAPVLPPFANFAGDHLSRQQPASATGLPSFAPEYGSHQSLMNPQMQAAMSSAQMMNWNNFMPPPPPHPTSMPQIPHMMPSYPMLHQFPRSAPNLPVMSAGQPSSVYLPTGFGGVGSPQSYHPGLASFASFGLSPVEMPNRVSASLAAVHGTMSDARLPMYSASAGQLDPAAIKTQKKGKKSRKSEEKERPSRKSKRRHHDHNRRRRRRRRTRSSSEGSSSYSRSSSVSSEQSSERPLRGSVGRHISSPRGAENSSKTSLPAFVSQVGPQIANLQAPTTTSANVMPHGVIMLPSSTPNPQGYTPFAPTLPQGMTNSLSWPVMPSHAMGNTLSMPVMPSHAMGNTLSMPVMPSHAMGNTLSMPVMPSHATGNTLSMPVMPSHAMGNSMPVMPPVGAGSHPQLYSSYTMSHNTLPTAYGQSNPNLPHARSVTMPTAQEQPNANARLTLSPRENLTSRTNLSCAVADSVASGTDHSGTSSVSQPTRDPSKAKELRAKKGFNGKVTYRDYLPLADLSSTPLANYWMKTAGWKLYKPTRTNGTPSVQNANEFAPPMNTPMMPTGFHAGAVGASGAFPPPTPVMRGVGGVPTFSSQRLAGVTPGGYPQMPLSGGVNEFSPLNVNTAVGRGLPPAVSNWVQPDVLNKQDVVQNRAASLDTYSKLNRGVSEIGSHAEITTHKDGLTAILHGNGATPLHGKRKLHPALARWLAKYPKECPATTKIVVKQLRPENDAVPAFPNVARSVIDNKAHQVFGPNGERVPPHHGPHRARNASVSDNSLCEVCGRHANDSVHEGFHNLQHNPIKKSAVCGCGGGRQSFTNFGENSVVPRAASIHAQSVRSFSGAGLNRGVSQQTLQRMPSKKSLRLEYSRNGPWKEDFFFFGPPKSSATPGCV